MTCCFPKTNAGLLSVPRLVLLCPLHQYLLCLSSTALWWPGGVVQGQTYADTADNYSWKECSSLHSSSDHKIEFRCFGSAPSFHIWRRAANFPTLTPLFLLALSVSMVLSSFWVSQWDKMWSIYSRQGAKWQCQRLRQTWTALCSQCTG